MASLSTDQAGRIRVMFTAPDQSRKAIRLGTCSKRQAEQVLAHAEHLLHAKITGTPPPRQTAVWLSDLPDLLHTRLARVGLVEPREAEQRHTLRGLLDAYFGVLDVKASTRGRYEQTERLLVEHFGDDRPLDAIDLRAAEGWRAWLVERGHAAATVSKNVGIARQLFRKAHRWGMVDANPFLDVKAGSQHNRERLRYVPPADVERLLDACPTHDWRCIVALARWGGLRTPSETLRVRWGDIDWERGRLRVRSPKTEGHDGGGERTIPLFPELKAVLLDAFDAAAEGSVYVVDGHRDATNANLRTHLLRIIDRAHLTPWPRLFNALRASRATELAAQYPIAVCTAWLGHTAAVAQAHYHMVRDGDYARAATEPTPGSGAKCGAPVAQNAAQRAPATDGKDRKLGAQPVSGAAFMPKVADPCGYPHKHRVSATGLEPVTSAM